MNLLKLIFQLQFHLLWKFFLLTSLLCQLYQQTILILFKYHKLFDRLCNLSWSLKTFLLVSVVAVKWSIKFIFHVVFKKSIKFIFHVVFKRSIKFIFHVAVKRSIQFIFHLKLVFLVDLLIQEFGYFRYNSILKIINK